MKHYIANYYDDNIVKCLRKHSMVSDIVQFVISCYMQNINAKSFIIYNIMRPVSEYFSLFCCIHQLSVIIEHLCIMHVNRRLFLHSIMQINDILCGLQKNAWTANTSKLLIIVEKLIKNNLIFHDDDSQTVISFKVLQSQCLHCLPPSSPIQDTLNYFTRLYAIGIEIGNDCIGIRKLVLMMHKR